MVGDIFFTKTLIHLIKCAKNSKWNQIKTWFFKRFLFGCSTANFGPLLAGHAHSPYVYHFINQNDSVVEEVEVFVNLYYGEGESKKMILFETSSVASLLWNQGCTIMHDFPPP